MRWMNMLKERCEKSTPTQQLPSLRTLVPSVILFDALPPTCVQPPADAFDVIGPHLVLRFFVAALAMVFRSRHHSPLSMAAVRHEFHPSAVTQYPRVELVTVAASRDRDPDSLQCMAMHRRRGTLSPSSAM